MAREGGDVKCKFQFSIFIIGVVIWWWEVSELLCSLYSSAVISVVLFHQILIYIKITSFRTSLSEQEINIYFR